MYTYLILICFILPLYAETEQTYLSATGLDSYTRYTQFINTLSKKQPDGSISIHSSGGAAGGIVSEGQGYGLFIAGATAVALGREHSKFGEVTTTAYNIFRAWKKMCTMSKADSSCQQSGYKCIGSDGAAYPCLPHWKFNDALSAVDGTGSAPDGDEDAILGMVLLVEVTAASKPTWWTEVAKWAYESIIQFYFSSVDASKNGESVLKLGACWGGWDCNNPSYHAPGAYRAFRNYISNYGVSLGKQSSEISDYVGKYNNLISSTYKLLLANQSPTSGLTTNWYVPNSVLSTKGTTACSGSGTPAAQFGAEASRGVWRVAIDYLWFPSEVPTATSTYLDRVVKQLVKKNTKSAPQYFDQFDIGSGELVTAVFDSWWNEAFMYGPTFTALIKPVSGVSGQADALNKAALKIGGATISEYYAGSWVAISTLTLSGDLAKAASLVATNLGPTPPIAPSPTPTPTPTKPPTPTPTPTPSPSPVMPPGSLSCGLAGAVVNKNLVEFVAPAISVSSAQVKCADNRIISCIVSGSKYQCASTGVDCNNPLPLVNGKNCPLTRGPQTYNCGSKNTGNEWWVEFVPPYPYKLELATVYCSDGRYIACGSDYSPKVGCDAKGVTCLNPIPIYNGSPCPYKPAAIIAESSTTTDNNTPFSSVAIIGIVIACVVLVLLVVAVLIITRRKNAEEIV